MTPLARVLMVLLAIVLVGCGETSRSFGGEITSVINQQASIDGEPAGGGDRIPVGGLLVTDDSGVAVFEVANDPATCELRPGSAVVVLPAQGLLLRLMRGTAVCDRSETDSSATFAAPGSLIEAGDSTIVIEVAPDGSTVGNVRGQVAVAPVEAGAVSAPQQAYIPLEGNQLTEVVDGEVPEPPRSYRPSPLEAEAVFRMNPAAVEPSDTTLPENAPTSSATTATTRTPTTNTRNGTGLRSGSA